MKTKFLIIILFTLISKFANAQTAEFAPLGAKWWYTEYWPDGPPNAQYRFHSEKDSIIGGLTFRDINFYRIEYPDSDTTETIHYLMFQDSTGIFFRDPFTETLMPYYNPNVLVGDTIKTFTYFGVEDTTRPQFVYSVVTNISDTIIAAHSLKKISADLIEDFENYFNPEYIEGIGVKGYYFPFIADGITDMQVGGPLRCFESAELGLVKFVEEDCEYIKMATEDLAQNEFTIYPNPAQDKIYFKCQNCASKTIQITNMLGNIFEADINWGNAIGELNISLIPAGVYILNINENDLMVTSQKFIKY